MNTFIFDIIYIFLLPGVIGYPLIPINKLSLATWGSYHQQDHKGPGTYAYGYDIEDPVTGNVQFKQEERHPNGTVTGSYGFVDADGKPRVVTYISDENGYRAEINVEGISKSKYHRSGDNLYENSFPNVGGRSENIFPAASQNQQNEIQPKYLNSQNEIYYQPSPLFYIVKSPHYNSV